MQYLTLENWFIHDKEMDESCLSKQFMETVDDELKKVFEVYLDEADGNVINKVHKSIQKLLKIKCEDFIKSVI